MPFICVGLRDGVRIHTGRGFVENGAIDRPEDVAALQAAGYEVVPHVRRDLGPSAEILAAMAKQKAKSAALDRAIKNHFRSLLRPLVGKRKSTQAEIDALTRDYL